MVERRFPFLNRVVLSGMVTRKPSLRTNKAGVATLKLSLTVSMPTLSDDMTRKRISVIRVSVFIVGDLATNCESQLANGSEIIVEGRLSSPPAHGSVSRLEVHAERVQLVDSDGALQFLERELLEQVTKRAVGGPTDSVVENTTEDVTERDGDQVKRVAAAETLTPKSPRRRRRSTTVPEKAGKDDFKAPVVAEVERESKPIRSRRKRPAVAVEAASSDRPKARSRRSSAGRASREQVQQIQQEKLESGQAVKDSTGEKTVVSASQRPTSTSRKDSSRRTERRPRRAVKDDASVKSDVQASDSKVKSRKGAPPTRPVSKPSKTSKSSKTTKTPDSPFELVETNDAFDPFLLEE